MEVRDQFYDPAALPLWKCPPVPIGQEDEWASRASLNAVAMRKVPVPTGNRVSALFKEKLKTYFILLYNIVLICMVTCYKYFVPLLHCNDFVSDIGSSWDVP
jgi:hypothetical protein